MTTVDIKTLREEHPDEFRRRYEDWAQHECEGYDWWDGVVEQFAERMKGFGVTVASDRRGGLDVEFSLGYCQSDYAAFTGHVVLHTWMQANGYAMTHMPLVLDMENYTATASVRPVGRSSYSSVGAIDYSPGQGYPSGIFSDLPQDVWDEMVWQQFESEGWEQLLDDWLRGECQQLYKNLQEEYEYLTSEDAFVEAMCGELFELEMTE